VAEIPERFTRDYGCTLAEWERWLPEATHGHAWHRAGPAEAEVMLPPGHLTLRWQVLPPRQIALIRLSRLEVVFGFEGVPAETRARFLRLFDLHTQRGGG
jgi:hypothetical protein